MYLYNLAMPTAVQFQSSWQKFSSGYSEACHYHLSSL